MSESASVALMVFDSMRKDTFDEYFDWLPGKRFERAYSTANWTGPAHASLFTGKYGSEVGVDSKRPRLDCSRPVLPERLSEEGYTTRGWSANPNASPIVLFDRGFDEFADSVDLQFPNVNVPNFEELAGSYAESSAFERYLHGTSWGRYLHAAWEVVISDYDTIPSLRHGLSEIRGTESPSQVTDDGATTVLRKLRSDAFGNQEFLFVNLMECHTPYHVPDEYEGVDGPVDIGFGDAYLGTDDPERVRKGYDASVQYLSAIYRDIFRELESKFDYVITLSDHGELLGEHHDMWNHVSGIYPELTHVPLVISGEGLSGRCDTGVSLIDVHRTVGELAGVDLDSRGRDLRSDLDPCDHIAEYRGPFTHSLERAKERGMDFTEYDRDLDALIGPDGYYGYEDYDGWRERGDPPFEDPQHRLAEIRNRLDDPGEDGGERGVSPDLVDQLEDLGYV